MLDPGAGAGSGAGAGAANERGSVNSHATFGGRGGAGALLAGDGPHNSQDRSRSREHRIINSSDVNAFAGLGSSSGGNPNSAARQQAELDAARSAAAANWQQQQQ